MPLMDLSIVIPTYNESHKIGRDIAAAGAFLAEQGWRGEIIVADDGSRDGTVEAAKERKEHLPGGVELRVMAFEHRGKGHAVRMGMRQTKGDYIMFADSGLCVPYRDALRGLEMIKSGQCEIAHGSRRLSQTKIDRPQNWYRKICSRTFRWVAHRFMQIPADLKDTQCGFKIYRGDVGRKIYEQCITDGFMFDVETILRAKKLGYRIAEFAIEWTCDRDSRITPARDIGLILGELTRIKKDIAANGGASPTLQ